MLIGRRTGRVALAAVALVTAGAVAQPAANATQGVISITYHIKATTHIKKLNTDIVVTGGKFKAAVNFVKGTMSGHISLPSSTDVIKLGNAQLAAATFQISEAKAITGTLDVKNFKIAVRDSFNIKIPKLTMLGLPFNLVGDNCGTSTPVTVALSGKANLSGPTTFSGTFTIPTFSNCGLMTPLLNLVVPGPGNTFTSTGTP